MMYNPIIVNYSMVNKKWKVDDGNGNVYQFKDKESALALTTNLKYQLGKKVIVLH